MRRLYAIRGWLLPLLGSKPSPRPVDRSDRGQRPSLNRTGEPKMPNGVGDAVTAAEPSRPPTVYSWTSPDG
jgi:hypothetical protein